MNTRAKGRRAEKEYADILKAQGYIVELVKGSAKFNKSVDLFGIADIIALHATGIYLIQVKSNRTDGAIKKLNEWYNQNMIYLPNNLFLQVIVRYDNRQGADKWRIINVV